MSNIHRNIEATDVIVKDSLVEKKSRVFDDAEADIEEEVASV